MPWRLRFLFASDPALGRASERLESEIEGVRQLNFHRFELDGGDRGSQNWPCTGVTQEKPGGLTMRLRTNTERLSHSLDDKRVFMISGGSG